jgi:hypothetical protein
MSIGIGRIDTDSDTDPDKTWRTQAQTKWTGF